MVNVATRVMLGRTLRELGYPPGLLPPRPYYGVKAPVFSFAKLTEVDVDLGPEMKSTGEIMGVNPDYPQALYKALVAAGVDVPQRGKLLVTIADRDKPEAADLIREFARLGFRIYATRGTSDFLRARGIENTPVKKISEGSPNLTDLIRGEEVDLLINTISKSKRPEREGWRIRRASVEHNLPCLTSLDTARALLVALSGRREGETFAVHTIDDYSRQGNPEPAPGS